MAGRLKRFPRPMRALLAQCPEVRIERRALHEIAQLEVYRRDGDARAVIVCDERADRARARVAIARQLGHWIVNFRRGRLAPTLSEYLQGERRAAAFAADALAPLWHLDETERRARTVERIAQIYYVDRGLAVERLIDLRSWRLLSR